MVKINASVMTVPFTQRNYILKLIRHVVVEESDKKSISYKQHKVRLKQRK